MTGLAWLKRLQKDDRGHVTLEATLIYPLIFLILLALLFFSVIVFERVMLYHHGAVMAEKTAFVWENRVRDPNTGAFTREELVSYDRSHDDLYWRLFTPFAVRWEAETDGREGRAQEIFFRQYAGRMPGAYASYTYSGRLYRSDVRVELSTNIGLPPFMKERFHMDGRVRTAGKAVISDPPEMIRTVDFFREYSREVRSRTHKGMYRGKTKRP